MSTPTVSSFQSRLIRLALDAPDDSVARLALLDAAAVRGTADHGGVFDLDGIADLYAQISHTAQETGDETATRQAAALSEAIARAAYDNIFQRAWAAHLKEAGEAVVNAASV